MSKTWFQKEEINYPQKFCVSDSASVRFTRVQIRVIDMNPWQTPWT